MKKILAGGLVAALAILPVTGAMAGSILPERQSLGGGDYLPDSPSPRGASIGSGDSLQLGSLGGAGVLTAAAIVIGIAIIAGSSNGTNGTN